MPGRPQLSSNGSPFPEPNMLLATRSTFMEAYISPTVPLSIIDTTSQENEPSKATTRSFRNSSPSAPHRPSPCRPLPHPRLPHANAVHQIIIRSSLETMKSCDTNPGIKKRATAGSFKFGGNPQVKASISNISKLHKHSVATSYVGPRRPGV